MSPLIETLHAPHGIERKPNRPTREEILWQSLPAFDLSAAASGSPYIHKSLIGSRACNNDVRRIDAPNGGYLVRVGQGWLTYDDTDEGLDRMEREMRLVDTALTGFLEVLR